MVTFDGVNLLIILPSVGTYDAEVDLYSDWKEWVLLGNAQFPPAFDTTGGDPISATEFIAPSFFLRNDLGWRIKAPEEDGEVKINGNLFGRDPDLAIFVPSDGDFTVLVQLTVSSRATVIETGTSGLTSEESDKLSKLFAAHLNRLVTDPATGKLQIYDDADTSVLLEGDIFEDAAGSQPYRGSGMERREQLNTP